MTGSFSLGDECNELFGPVIWLQADPRLITLLYYLLSYVHTSRIKLAKDLDLDLPNGLPEGEEGGHDTPQRLMSVFSAVGYVDLESLDWKLLEAEGEVGGVGLEPDGEGAKCWEDDAGDGEGGFPEDRKAKECMG